MSDYSSMDSSRNYQDILILDEETQTRKVRLNKQINMSPTFYNLRELILKYCQIGSIQSLHRINFTNLQNLILYHNFIVSVQDLRKNNWTRFRCISLYENKLQNQRSLFEFGNTFEKIQIFNGAFYHKKKPVISVTINQIAKLDFRQLKTISGGVSNLNKSFHLQNKVMALIKKNILW